MHIVRKVALTVLSPLFVILLFALALDVGFIRTATHPQTVKRLVSESGIYSAVVPNVLQQTKSISTQYGDIPVTDPIIQKAANNALPPAFIKQNTEAAIDNVYQWLDGKIAAPNFNINLTGVKTLFANNIADAVQKKLGGLPACTTTQSLAIARSGQFDAYNATCLPRGISPALVAEQVKSSVAGGQGFLENPNISAADIKDSNNQSIFGQQGVKNIPKQYHRAKKTPWILAILTVLTGVGIVFLSSTWQKGLRHIGINLVIIGVLMLVVAWGINRTVSKNIIPKIMVDNAVLQQDVRNLATDLAQQIDKNYWFFGSLYTVLGAMAVGGYLLGSRTTRPVLKPARPKQNRV